MKFAWLFVSGLLAHVVCAAAAEYSVLQRFQLGGAGGWDYLTLDPATQRL